MIETLEILWSVMGSTSPTIRQQRLERWPPGVAEQLQAWGFLLRGEASSRVVCPECRTHVEEIVTGNSPDGVEFFIPCPELIRVQIHHAERQLWSIQHEAVARTLAASLQLSGKCSALEAGRCWRLGRATWHGESRDVVLARGMTWPDGDSLRASIRGTRKPIVFVPREKPDAAYWQRRVPPVIALDTVAALGASGIEIDPVEVLTAIQDADAASPNDETLVTRDQLTLAIRRQVKAERQSELTDAIFIAAYRQHGSVRKAAEFLSQQTGAEVTKDKVYQAVKRAGGAAEVLNAENSESVIRPVASQPRDKKGKPLIRFQTPAEE